jgi:hypothetical protein
MNWWVAQHLAFCTTEALMSIFRTTRSNLDEYMALAQAELAGSSSSDDGTTAAARRPLPNEVVA